MAWPLQKNDLYPRITDTCQDVLSRLVSLEPRELCSEAIVEKCRATRDLRSCGRIVEHSLTSCNHASLCAECGQRCDVCPICRAAVSRHGPPMKLRLYEECCEAGLISSRTEDIRERDGQLGADVQRLWFFFDIALEYKLVSVICHYVSDVCMDESAVSSHANVSRLLDGIVVKDWCKRTMLHVTRSLREIYCLGTTQMRSKEGDMERYSTKLLGLSRVLECLEGPLSDAFSAPVLELQQLIEGIRRVSQHLDMMCWCARHRFLEDVQSSHPSMSDWRTAVKGRKLAANSRLWPDHTRIASDATASTSATLFVEDAMSNVGFGKGNENAFLWENLELGSLRQTPTSTSRRREGIGQSVPRVSAAIYPPESVRGAVDFFFLEASADLFLAKKAIFLYYLFDRHWPNHSEDWKHILDDYILTFDISRHAVLESWVFFLLDEKDDMALEEACCLLPEVVSRNIHPKVARVLLERQKPHVALDVLHCSNGDRSLRLSGLVDQDEIPGLQDAVTAVRVRLECGLLTDAYLYQSSYISRVKAQAQRGVIFKSKFGSEDNPRDWSSDMELLVEEICCLSIRKNLVAKMIELPWHVDEEKVLLKCLLEQATLDPCSTAGSLMVMFYILRCRNQEAYVVHRRLSTIERSYLDQCRDVEKIEVVKSICTQRTILVERGVELLPKSQQDQLRTGSLDHLLLPSTERRKEPVSEPSSSKATFPDVQAELPGPGFISYDGKSDSLPSYPIASPDSVSRLWGNYLQPSILHGKPFITTSTVPDGLSQLDLATTSSITPQKEHSEGLLSPILRKKLPYNAVIEGTSLATRNLRAVMTQDVRDSIHVEGSKIITPTSNDHIQEDGTSEPIPSFNKSKSYLQELDGRSSLNERMQNGASIALDNGPETAFPLFRWSENGALDLKESPRSNKASDSTTRETKYRLRRPIMHLSPNGKRKAHDQLDVVFHDAAAGDGLLVNNSKTLGSEQQKGFVASGADINSSHSRRKNGPRWRLEDDGLDLPPPPVTGGRTKASAGIGRASGGIRAFRSHAL